MWTQISRISTSFIAVLAAYFAYALIAVPLIEPSIRKIEAQGGEFDGQDIAIDQRKFLKNFFPEGSWQLGRTKLLESKNVILLMKDFKERDQNTLELFPVTIIALASEDEKERFNKPPLILEGEKALLRFDQLDLAYGKIGRLQAGHLQGNVRIHKNALHPEASDSLFIVTKDVQLSPTRIETKHQVQFKLGPNTGSGRHLIAELLQDKIGGNQNAPNIKGLKSLQLNQIDRVQIAAQGKGLFGGPTQQSSQEASEDSAADKPDLDKFNSNAPVEITCAGPFLFDGMRQIASFRDQVLVRRMASNANPDRMKADILEVHFDQQDPITKVSEKDKKTSAKEKPANLSASGQGNMTKLKIAKIVAVGQPVQLVAPSVNSSGQGDQLIYDVTQHRIEMTGKPFAFLRREDQELRSPALQYEIAENTNRLGQVWAAGPGSFQGSIQSNKSDRFQVFWQKQLRIDLVNTEHVLSLDGQVKVVNLGQGQLQADKLTMWLRSLTDPHSDRTKLIPDRLQALGNVMIDSPRFSGETPELKAWFQYAKPITPAPQNKKASSHLVSVKQSETKNQIKSSTTNSQGAVQKNNAMGPKREIRQKPIVQSNPMQTAQPIARIPQPVEPKAEPEKSKFHMTGKQVQLVIKFTGKETEIENATISGDVLVKELLPPEKKTEPMSIRGDVVQITHANSERSQIHIIGNPGMVAGQGIQLYSKHLQLDQITNRAWSDGPGQVVLPMDRDLEGKKLATPQLYTVVWQGKMNFQHDRLSLENGVEIRGRNHRVNTSRLEITLEQPVNFQKLSSKFQPKVKRIQCFDGFTMFGHTVENGQWQSQDYFEARSLSINQITGAIFAQGPGYLRTTRFGFESLASNQFTGTANDRPQKNAASQKRLGFLQVNFNREVTGDLFKKEITFHHVNQAIYGPVNDWNEVIDPNSIHGIGPEAFEMKTQKLTVVQMQPISGTEKPIEIYAIGNAEVRGRLFSAWADRITYSTTKGLLSLQGNGRNTARLTHQQAIGGARQNAEAGTIMFWPKQGRLKVNNAKYIDVNSLQSFGAP